MSRSATAKAAIYAAANAARGAARGVLRRTRSSLLLSEDRALAARLGSEERDRIASILALGRQRAAGAELLWANGRAADGLRMAGDALERTLEAVPVYAEATTKKSADAEENTASDEKTEEYSVTTEDAEPLAVHRATLLARGMRAEALDRLRALLDRIAEPLPLHDAEVEVEHSQLFTELVRARESVDRALGRSALGPWSLRLMLTRRLLALTLGLAAAAAGLYFAQRTPTQVTPSASSFYNEVAVFAPESAFDGDPATEWLAQGSTGWLEAELSPPRNIQRFRLLNSHNRHYNDRATHQYRIELYRDGEVVKTIQGTFPRLLPRPEWAVHDEGADQVDRIRLVVLSGHRAGAGLAELQWDER